MSESFNIYEGPEGIVEASHGCAGVFYDAFNAAGAYVGTKGTLERAKALLQTHSGRITPRPEPLGV